EKVAPTRTLAEFAPFVVIARQAGHRAVLVTGPGPAAHREVEACLHAVRADRSYRPWDAVLPATGRSPAEPTSLRAPATATRQYRCRLHGTECPRCGPPKLPAPD